MIVDRAAPFRELADFLRAEKIPSCVLHGIDPVSGELGRDLDLYVPDRTLAYRTALFFAGALKRRGVRWVSLMHPIWGPRCVGIQKQNLCYWELHILTHLSVAWVDFGATFPMVDCPGPYGFNFNPSLWFVKDVIYKHARKFARRHPVWVDFHPHGYNLAHQQEIEARFQERWRNGAKFVSAALDPDTANNLRARQRELFVLMAGQCLRRPVSSSQSTRRWLGRKLAALSSASVPVIEVDTPMESRELRQCLREKLGHAFQPIEVTERPLPMAARISLQSRQSLLILHRRRSENASSPEVTNRRITIPSSAHHDIDAAVVAILDRIFNFNSQWAARYRKRALD